MGAVFVTDAQQRKSLAVIRSLGRRGISVTAGDSRSFALSFFSKYCNRSVVYPSPKKKPELFIEWLIDYLKSNRCDVLLATDDDSLMAVTRFRDDLSRYTLVPVVDYGSYMKARNKADTIKIALKHSIPCPRTYFVNDLKEMKVLADHISYPAIIKPRESSGSRGIVYVESRDVLYSAYRRVHNAYSYPLIQELIPSGGATYGVSALFNAKSEPRAVFVHQRIREFPPSGGPSTLRESVSKPELVELAFKLLRALKWYGVAMVEFKMDPRDGKPKLMEVNSKFWGSLQLAICSGVDFPYLLYKMARDRDIEPLFEYEVGIRCRWLLGDVLHFIFSPRRLETLPDFFKIVDKNTHFDILSIEDLGPALGSFLSFSSRLFHQKIWKDVMRR